MKTSLRFFLTFVVVLCACIATRAANFTTAVQQAGGLNWSQAIWQPGGVTPTAGNTYECVAGGNPTRIRNPVSGGIQTFPGDSLQLDAATEIRAKIPLTAIDFPGVGGNAGLIMNGGNLDTGDNGAVFTITGVMLVQAPSTFTCGDASANDTRGWRVETQIRGSAGLTITKNFATGVAAVDVLSANNPFTGSWTVNGGLFRASGSGSLGSGNITINPGTAGASFEPMYDIVSPGSLILSPGNVVMNLHQACSFVGVTINGTALSDGVHDWAELNANFPTYFPSGSGSITVQPPPPPPAPLNLTAVNGDGEVTLNWSAAATASSYNVKRSSTPGGPYTIVGTVGVTTFVDPGLANGSTYYYVVSGVNGGGEGASSTEVVGRPNNAVTGLTATGGTGQVALAWNALPGASSYNVKRSSTSGGPYTNIATGVLTTSYLDTSVQSGRSYYYVVAGVLTAGEGGLSSQAIGTTASGAPTNVTVVLFASTVLRVGWTAEPVVSQYFIEQSTDNVNFSPLATLPGNQPSYTNSGLALNTTYFYRVQAQNGSGLSGYSIVASNTTPTFGINVDFALPAAPAAVGYLHDSGQPYADRGNGYTYGWDRDIVADARQRNAANSPDIRYDTFVHLIKATPPAIWNIAIPNGLYRVRIVAGDPSNSDSVFQFDVEGELTGTVTPGGPGSVNNFWADFTVVCGVSDGQLTVKSGPNSQTTANNNKIAFIDIYPDVALPPVIGVQPQAQTVEEFRPVSLSVTLSQGSPKLNYQWYRDNNPVPDATNGALSFAHVRATDAGNYFVIVTNYGGAATSAVATLTVTPDTTKPYLVSVASLDGTSIGVCFSEEMDNSQNVVTEAGNYQINDGIGAFVQNVTLRPDRRSVNLVLNQPISGPYMLTVFSQRDLAGNLADTLQTNGVVLGFTTGDVGAPALVGSHFSCDGDSVEVVGGGVDIWGNADQGYFVTKTASGDFDARIRVTSLAGSNAITKAVLVARESRSADSRGIHVSVNPPPPGRNQVEMGLRSTTGGATAAVGSSFIPAGVPNAWMRITRVGDIFTGYRSTNGVSWIQLGQTTVSFPADMVVGFGVTSHDNTLLATGAFSGFTTSQQLAQAPIINPRYLAGSGFSAAIQTQNGVTYAIQYKDNLAAASWSPLSTFVGDGTVKTFNDPTPGVPMRFYRIIIQ
jgi:hypothetical protein